MSSTRARGAMLAVVAVLSGCASTDPWESSIAREEEKGACMNLMEARLAESLGTVSMPGDLADAAKVVVAHLPEQERAALLSAGQMFLAEHGKQELPRGGELERKAYWSVLYRGFAELRLCEWSRQQLRGYAEAAIFADKLDALLRARGVNTGSPTFAHTDLIAALVRAAAKLPSNNSSKPTPLRGAA